MFCPAQQTASNKIVLRLLDGRNGKSLTDNQISIWIGDAKPLLSTAYSKGEVTLDIAGAQPPEIRVLSKHYFDCRFKKDVRSGGEVKYSLNEITSKGITGENQCGKFTASPTPGVLILFLRPRSFSEKLQL
jgi:hypothetical protein